MKGRVVDDMGIKGTADEERKDTGRKGSQGKHSPVFTPLVLSFLLQKEETQRGAYGMKKVQLVMNVISYSKDPVNVCVCQVFT